ncbi:hypothetical protein [Desulfosporosinus metallidurans]|uniref:Uncharacterized protein n=1 Tax=Desulfosporosinus metallidurans TaxID=1888891 RepID=A0A1Q8QE13_9FIRM|nr:hypothetical protein [Desulfosporosinus metallidurans]OLN25522.1 hypothetical protein DSOL_5297 [Desulfosporosinus metallidurans]
MGLLQSKPDDLATTGTKSGGRLLIDRMAVGVKATGARYRLL